MYVVFDHPSICTESFLPVEASTPAVATPEASSTFQSLQEASEHVEISADESMENIKSSNVDEQLLWLQGWA